MSTPAWYLLLAQCLYFGLTGIWPVLDIDSFIKITGPKTDLWLVKTVGLLITVIAAALAVSLYRNALPPETLVLAVGAAAALMFVDVVYVLRRRIMRIYLLDAAAELLLIAAWLTLLATGLV